MEYLIGILIFYLGGMTGFFLRAWLGSRSRYDGVIFVTKEDHKTLYSLVLEEYPDAITLKKEVVFKVDASQIEDLDRKQN
jgi:nitrogen regulatory protein PII-like uncharacterized protein